MKRILRLPLTLLVTTVFLASCSTATHQMQILHPAEITFPSSIKQVGLINRSLPAKGQGFNNVLEGFITGESIGADREGSLECLRGLSSGLNDGPRFTAVIIDGVDLRGTGTRQWPEFLESGQINELCDRFRVDAIVALETFDSDVELANSSADVEKIINKQKVVVKEYYADLRLNVSSGWTVYSPETDRIIDRNVFTDRMHWKETGDSKENAVSKLPSKRRAINESGFFSGKQYARRISPSWVLESREYYRKANDDFKIASKYVKSGDWDDAIPFWKKYVKYTDTKISGRACYNMALASEVDGNLPIAIEWAQKSWKECGNRKARAYIQVLQMREAEQVKLQKQMKD